MKLTKTLGVSVAATAMAAAATFAPVANAEVSASVGIASQYLWRGFNLGDSVPAVSADISYSEGGFYTGAWVSSGDTTAGTEYDLFIGYGGEVGSFSYDLSLVSYIYPTGPGYNGTPDGTDIGDFVDVVIGLGAGPVSLTLYKTISGEDEVWADEDYFYANLGVAFGSFTASLGYHDAGLAGDTLIEGDEPVHLQLDYAYNDNLTFTVTKFIQGEAGATAVALAGSGPTVDEDIQFVASYSLPIDM